MNFKNTNQLGFFAALFSAFAWSTTGIFVRFLNGFSSIEIIAGRCLIGLIFILLIFLVRRKSLRNKIWKSKQAWGLGTLMAGYFLLAVTAFQMAPVAEVAILINTTPLFALIYKRIKRVSISTQEIWGIFLGLAGVVLVVVSGNSSAQTSFGTTRLIGDFMALIAGGSMAVYSILYTAIPTYKRPSSQIATFFTFLIGSALSLLIISFSGKTASIENYLDLNAFYFLLGLGVFATLLPTLSYAYASSVLDSVIVTALRLVTPLLAAVLGIVFLTEIPNVLFWPGALILLTGLFLIIKSK